MYAGRPSFKMIVTHPYGVVVIPDGALSPIVGVEEFVVTEDENASVFTLTVDMTDFPFA